MIMTEYSVLLDSLVWSTLSGVLDNDIRKVEEHIKDFPEERFITLFQRLSAAKAAIDKARKKHYDR